MTDREEIFEALAKLGHEPSYIELDGRPQSLHALSRCDADLIFNLTESFDGDDTKEMNVVAYVDLLGIPYTGAGPHAIFLAQDQSGCEENFSFSQHQDSILRDCLSRPHEHAHDISFPLIVQAWAEDIDRNRRRLVVTNIKELMERHSVHQDEFDSPR